ncbi:hypothetical protein AA700_0415 [Acidiphilium acidophilum DSM 700]|nr:hypothetical protein AA700_0415 [Acidiphilium acidophilum DSM 700]
MGAPIYQMRGEQDEQPQSRGTASRDQIYVLQDAIVLWISNNSLFYYKVAASGLVSDCKQRHSGSGTLDRCDGVAFFLDEEAAGNAVGDDQSAITGTGLIDAGVVNFVENSVTMGKPDGTARRQRRSDTIFRA